MKWLSLWNECYGTSKAGAIYLKSYQKVYINNKKYVISHIKCLRKTSVLKVNDIFGMTPKIVVVKNSLILSAIFLHRLFLFNKTKLYKSLVWNITPFQIDHVEEILNFLSVLPVKQCLLYLTFSCLCWQHFTLFRQNTHCPDICWHSLSTNKSHLNFRMSVVHLRILSYLWL